MIKIFNDRKAGTFFKYSWQNEIPKDLPHLQFHLAKVVCQYVFAGS